jgi:hypothetical protein
MKKYYFFRDLDSNPNYWSGKKYHSAGYVDEWFCEIGEPSKSGKDIDVCFFDPFCGCITNEWRALDAVELFEVSEI